MKIMTKTALLGCIAGFALTACVERVEPEQAVPPTETQIEAPAETPASASEAPRPSLTVKRAEIDWDSARIDLAARENTSPEGAFAIASGSGAPPVPVLLPSAPVTTASVGEESLQFRPLADGYFAIYPGETYDILINGTDKLVAAPGRSGTATDSGLRYEETMIGGQVAFSRYGASYLVEFACKGNAANVGTSCITEAEALAAVEDLLIAGTR